MTSTQPLLNLFNLLFLRYNFHMDTIDKFYLLCALYDDDIKAVIMALKKAGARDRPYRIEINIDNLHIEKYSGCIDGAIIKLSEEY